MSFDRFYGWDIGGAHLKVAELGTDGRPITVNQYATPLWQGLELLNELLSTLPGNADATRGLHALTMTGELVDFFPDRRTGVDQLLDQFSVVLAPENTRVYAMGSGLVGLADARLAPERVASANWHATASVAGRLAGSGILLDIGSTTTDIVPFRDGRVRSRGRTDQERLQCNELVYTGVTRTPVMALARRVPFAGRWQNLAAELFATTADVHRITGDLDEALDLQRSADGGGKTSPDSLRRLARMVGTDFGPQASTEDLQEFSAYLALLQVQQIRSAVQCVWRESELPDPGVIVGAGSGIFLAKRIAADLGFHFTAISDLFKVSSELRTMADVCASALAVAELGRQQAGA